MATGLIMAIVNCVLHSITLILISLSYYWSSWGTVKNSSTDEYSMTGITVNSTGQYLPPHQNQNQSLARPSQPRFRPSGEYFDFVDPLTGVSYQGLFESAGEPFEKVYSSLENWFSATGTTQAEQEALRQSRKIVVLIDVLLTPIDSLAPELERQTMNRWRFAMRNYKVTMHRKM